MQRNYDSHNDRGRFTTAIIAIVAVVVAVIIIMGGGGMMGAFGMMGAGMLFTIPIGLIVLVIIGYAIWHGFGWEGDHNGHHNRYASADEDIGSAMEILRRRYAKGEITKEQFEQMKKDLNT